MLSGKKPIKLEFYGGSQSEGDYRVGKREKVWQSYPIRKGLLTVDFR